MLASYITACVLIASWTGALAEGTNGCRISERLVWDLVEGMQLDLVQKLRPRQGTPSLQT